MPLHLKLHTQPEVPLEADCICPDIIQSLKNDEITAMTVFHGNRQVELGEFFECNGSFDGEINIDGDLSNIKHVGASMSFGKITVEGNIGLHTGAGMRGGEIIIEDNHRMTCQIIDDKIVCPKKYNRDGSSSFFPIEIPYLVKLWGNEMIISQKGFF